MKQIGLSLNIRYPHWPSFKKNASLLACLPIFGFALIGVYGFTSPRFLTGEKELQIVILGLCAVTIVRGCQVKPISRGAINFSSLYFFLALILALGNLFSSKFYTVWFLSDLAIFFAPMIIFLYFEVAGRLADAALIRIFLFLSIAALIAPLFALGADSGRYEAPLFYSYALLAYGTFFAPNLSYRRLSLLLFFTLLILGWFSQWRFVPAAALILFGLVWVGGAKKYRMLILAMTFAVGSISILALEVDTLEISTDHRRFQKISSWEGFYDEVIKRREAEIHDVFESYKKNGNFLTHIVGMGHGATFRGDQIVKTLGNSETVEWRVSNSGHIHVIHFGPARIFYRYGIIGLTLFALLFFFVFKHYLHYLRFGANNPICDISNFVLIVLLMRFFLQPIEFDWQFWIAVAILLRYKFGAKTRTVAVRLRHSTRANLLVRQGAVNEKA